MAYALGRARFENHSLSVLRNIATTRTSNPPPTSDTIEGPPTVVGLNDGAVPSLARLNYGADADADAEEPRIAALPVALPILVGVLIPAHGNCAL